MITRRSGIPTALLQRFDAVIETLTHGQNDDGAKKVVVVAERLKDGMASGISSPVTFEHLVGIGELVAQAYESGVPDCDLLVDRFLGAAENELEWWLRRHRMKERYRQRRQRMLGCIGFSLLILLGILLGDHYPTPPGSVAGHALIAIGFGGSWWCAYLLVSPNRDLYGRKK